MEVSSGDLSSLCHCGCQDVRSASPYTTRPCSFLPLSLLPSLSTLLCTLYRSSAVKPDLSFTVIGGYVKQTWSRSRSQDQGRETGQKIFTSVWSFPLFFPFFFHANQCVYDSSFRWLTSITFFFTTLIFFWFLWGQFDWPLLIYRYD